MGLGYSRAKTPITNLTSACPLVWRHSFSPSAIPLPPVPFFFWFALISEMRQLSQPCTPQYSASPPQQIGTPSWITHRFMLKRTRPQGTRPHYRHSTPRSPPNRCFFNPVPIDAVDLSLILFRFVASSASVTASDYPRDVRGAGITPFPCPIGGLFPDFSPSSPSPESPPIRPALHDATRAPANQSIQEKEFTEAGDAWLVCRQHTVGPVQVRPS